MTDAPMADCQWPKSASPPPTNEELANEAAKRLGKMSLFDVTRPVNQKTIADMPLEMVHAILEHIPVVDALQLYGGPLHPALTTHPTLKKLLSYEVVLDLQWLHTHKGLFKNDPTRMKLHTEEVRKLHITEAIHPYDVHRSLSDVINMECKALTPWRLPPSPELPRITILDIYQMLFDPTAHARIQRIIDLQRSALTDFPGMLKWHSDPTDEARQLGHLLTRLDTLERNQKRSRVSRPDRAYLAIAGQSPRYVPYARYIKLVKYLDPRVSADPEAAPVSDLVRGVVDTHVPFLESDYHHDQINDVERRCEAVVAICKAVQELQARQDKHGEYARTRGKVWLQVRF